MEYKDIQLEILVKLSDYDQELVRFCSVDKEARKMCHSQFFWDKVFQYHNLPLSSFKYTSIEHWMTALKAAKKLQSLIDTTINALITADGFYYVDGDYDENHELIFNCAYSFDYVEVFKNVEEIDIETLQVLNNTSLIFYYTELLQSFIKIAYDIKSDTYNLLIFLQHGEDQINDEYVYNKLSEKTIRSILYRLYKLKMIPFNRGSGHELFVG